MRDFARTKGMRGDERPLLGRGGMRDLARAKGMRDLYQGEGDERPLPGRGG